MWYADLMKEPLEALMAASPRPANAELLFQQMMRDIMTGPCADPVEQVGVGVVDVGVGPLGCCSSR